MDNKIVFIYDEYSDIPIDYSNILISLEYVKDLYETNTDINVIIEYH